jgi:hypothetical protein
MPTVKEILRDKVTLDIRSVDRVLLNGWVKNLQMPGGVVNFIREQRGWKIPSPVMLNNLTVAFRTAVEQFAAAQGLEIVDFEKGESKEKRAQAALAHFAGKRGVVLIGKAQEETSSFKGRRDDKGTKVWFTYRRESVRVTHYYFYVLDEDFGLAFIKVCTYLPFAVKVCFNGHEWAKQQLTKEGIAFDALDNGFAQCADSPRLQAICHHLTAEAIQAFFDRWVDQLPWPLSPTEREAGYRHDLSVWQLEVSRTQVFADPEQGRALVETLIRENLDLGRPDRVRVIFERQVTKRTPSEFQTQVLQHGVIPSIKIHYKHSSLKQYLKEDLALRTEMMINNPYDFGCPRGIAHFADLVALGQTFNDRLLDHEEVPQDCFVNLETVRRLGQSTLDAQGQRASALRFGDHRVMALLGALTNFGLIVGGLSNKTLRRYIPDLLEVPAGAYSGAHMSYDLRRLRLKGLITRVPRSQRYILTELGTKVAVFFTKLYTRVYRPGLAALAPSQPLPSLLAQALTTVSDLIQSALLEAHVIPTES